ncbi:MAG: AI-2E family transporter [Rhizobiales bacterium]|nr:AI-2E family transporter [Hyphomicrobiales bacterium]
MSVQRQAMIWMAVVLVTAFSLWLFSGILLPFVLGMAVAYCLDPLADRLEDLGLSRIVATSLITLAFVLLTVAFGILVLPALFDQAVSLVNVLPELIDKTRAFVVDVTHDRLGSVLGISSGKDVEKALTGAVQNTTSWLPNLLSAIGYQGLQLVSLITMILVTPVVAFYLLLDWDRMVAEIDTLLPRDHAETIRELMRETNSVLEGFVRGQAIVCLALGVFYAIGLSLAGLKFGLIVGIAAGVISFIPYLGTITGFVTAIGLALFQFWPDYVQIGIIAGIFLLGQFIEGNFLSPKLVGNRVKLHAVWVIFALFAFGSLFGFVGALVGLPMAAVIGVLARFLVRRYRQSALYRGHQELAVPENEQDGASAQTDPK